MRIVIVYSIRRGVVSDVALIVLFTFFLNLPTWPFSGSFLGIFGVKKYAGNIPIVA